jgi:hypothetical protein
MRFKYTWYHIPTGKTGEGEGDFDSEVDFLRHLNNWNRSGMNNWLYRSTHAIMPALPAAILRFPPKELTNG